MNKKTKLHPFITGILIAMLLWSPTLWGAPETIDDKPEKSTLAGTEYLLISDAGVYKKVSVANDWKNAVITSGTITGSTYDGLTITSTTGTLTIPNGVTFNGPSVTGLTAATLTGVETLTNKTISGSTFVTPDIGVATATSINGVTINSATGSTILDMADGVQFTVSATGEAALLTNVQTLTNKTISFGSNTLSATSAQLRTAVSDETGTGVAVFATSPTLVTPVLGVATATSLNGLTVTASTGTLTIADLKTATVSNTLTFTGTDGSTASFGAGGIVAYQGDNLSVFASTTSAQLAGVLSNETGSGLAVFATSPTLTTPTIGVATATSINKMAITAPATSSTLAVADGKTLTSSNTLTLAGTDGTTITFQGTGTYVMRSSTDTLTNKTVNLTSNTLVATSAQLATAVTNETGSGLLVFGTSPTLTTPVLSGSITGTYTLAGTPTIATPTITSPTVTNAIVTPKVTTITGDGAITIASGVVKLTKGSAAAITIVAPSSQDGTCITITSHSDFAHVVTFTGGTLLDGTTGANTTATFAAFKGASITVIASGNEWLVESINQVTCAP